MQILKKKNNSNSNRIIGDLKGQREGPTVIVLGGIHGNEPTGIETMSRFFSRIKEEKPLFRGRLIGLQGNMNALQKSHRFVDEDLNRIWSEAIIRKIRNNHSNSLYTIERQELRELLDVIDPLLERVQPPAYIVDLHSFSAREGMFAISERIESHVQLLKQMNVPVVHGLGSELGGTVLDFFRRRGHVAMAFEGGNHNDPKTITNKTAILYQLLAKTGNIPFPHSYNELQEHTRYLQEQTKGYPKVSELIYRYKFEQGDQFTMHPGYSNFHWVEKGEHVADDRFGKIHTSREGYLLMPLYQQQGTDGFFLIQDT